MADNSDDIGKGDRIRASLQKHEVQYVAKKLGITGQAAAGAVRAAEPMRKTVYGDIKVKKKPNERFGRSKAAKYAANGAPQKSGVHPHRTLHGWAISTLLETHAIVECPEHGHIRDRGSWAHGWDEAKGIAKSDPFEGSEPAECLATIDGIMLSIGDVCPDCRD